MVVALPAAAASTRSTTSVSSAASSESKSPSRAAARNASTSLPLAHEIRCRVRGLAAHAATGAGRELGRGVLRSAHDRRDLGERQVEHVVQHERQPLGGRQPLQDDEQRHPDRVGEQRLLFRVDRLCSRRVRGGIRLVERLLGSGAAGPQRVQTDARDDGRQPAPHVAYVGDVGAVHPQPCLLNGVLGLGQRAQHAVGDRTEMRPVLLELIHGRRPSCEVMIRCCGSSYV